MVELVDPAGQLSNAADQIPRDLHPDRGGISGLEATGDLDLPGRVEQHPLGQQPVGPEIVQPPARSLINSARSRMSRSRCSPGSRISSSTPARRTHGKCSSPSRSPTEAIASASIGSDLPPLAHPLARAGHQQRPKRTTVSR
jgi:hypothetical protein